VRVNNEQTFAGKPRYVFAQISDRGTGFRSTTLVASHTISATTLSL
jgi:hypothetical protein